MIDGVNGLNKSQISTLLDSSKLNKEKDHQSEMVKKSKGDLLDISTQIDMLNKSNPKKINYSDLEAKLGIDSNKWGVEAVSDNLINFVQLSYERYKLSHKDTDDPGSLEKFYEMAKSSYTKGFGEAQNMLGVLPDDVQSLIEGTMNHTMEKLDKWFENGGEIVNEEEVLNTEEIIEKEVIKNEVGANNQFKDKNLENLNKIAKELLKESEDFRTKLIDELVKQGLFTKESVSKKPNFDLEG